MLLIRGQSRCKNMAKENPFPDMPCIKKYLERKEDVGPLFSSQEKKTFFVPLVNNGSNGCQPLIMFRHSCCMKFRLFVYLETRAGDLVRFSSVNEGRLPPWRSVQSACHFAQPRPAVRPCAPIRPHPWFVWIMACDLAPSPFSPLTCIECNWKTKNNKT